MGVEPTTSSMPLKRSSQLSYVPIKCVWYFMWPQTECLTESKTYLCVSHIRYVPTDYNMVEKKGVEPSTSAMRMLRSSQLSYFPIELRNYNKTTPLCIKYLHQTRKPSKAVCKSERKSQHEPKNARSCLSKFWHLQIKAELWRRARPPWRGLIFVSEVFI